MHFSIWVNINFFDSEKFSSTVTETLSTQSSRDAISYEITDQLLKEKPILRQLARDRLSEIISIALESDLSNRTIENTAKQANVYMTSSSQEQVKIDISGVKRVISAASKGLDLLDGDQFIEEESIPDDIVLIKANSIPSLSKLGSVNSLFIIASLLTVLIICGVFYFGLKLSKSELAIAIGKTLVLSSIIGLSISRFAKSSILTKVESVNMRIVIGDSYSAFVSHINFQFILALSIGIALIVFPIGWNRYVSKRSA